MVPSFRKKSLQLQGPIGENRRPPAVSGGGERSSSRGKVFFPHTPGGHATLSPNINVRTHLLAKDVKLDFAIRGPSGARGVLLGPPEAFFWYLPQTPEEYIFAEKDRKYFISDVLFSRISVRVLKVEVFMDNVPAEYYCFSSYIM